MDIDAIQQAPAGSPGDFDFLRGRWKVSHRRLLRRLAGCTDWQSFDGTCHQWPLLDGLGNVDDNWMDLPGGAYRAATLRAFDPATRQWSIWWLDGRAPGRIDIPMRGGFDGAVGLFFADEDFEGRPIRVRFLWQTDGPDRCSWQQAFSPDGGRTWETNWVMQFARSA